MDNNLTSKAINAGAWNLFDKIFNHAGGFVLLVYLSRVLSPSDFGLIAMLAIFLAVAQSLIDSGFSQALIQKSKNVTEKDLSTVFCLNLAVSLLLYFTLYLLAPYIAEFYKQSELIDVSRVLFIVIIINAISLVPKTRLIIEVDFKSQTLISSLSMLISTFVAIFMVNQDFGYWSLVGMNISKSILNSILLIAYSKWIPHFYFSINSFKSLFSFGSNILIAGLVATVIQNLYSVLIGKHLNVVNLGYYQQGHNYTNILSSTLSSVIQGVTYPIMTSIQEDEERLVQAYIKVMGLVMFVTFPILVGFASVAEEFVILFLGEKWMPIIPIIIILSFTRLITPVSVLNLNILNARGRSDLYLKTDLSKLPLTIIALLISVPHGLVAVAFAQLICVLISFFINSYYPGKLFGFGSLKQLKLMAPVAFSSMIMFFALSFIQNDNLIIQVITKIFIGALIYFSLSKALKISAFDDIVTLVCKFFKK